MSEYSTTKEFKNLNRNGKHVNLTVKANGGSVTLNRFIAGVPVLAATVVTDGCFEVLVDDAPLQIVPTGGAVYYITE